METIPVKIKLLNEKAVVPTYAHKEDACFDLTAVSYEFDELGNVIYHTGIAMEIPDGYVGRIYPRSSICKKEMFLTNCVGTIDSNYRGEILLKFKMNTPRFKKDDVYEVGDRIAQMCIEPVYYAEFEVVDILSDSSRGTGGYGSTGA